LTKFGWEKYNKVNLKFKNQVVCEKRESSANIDGDLITDAQRVKEDTTVNREQ
jgi:hypothetical protein